MKRQLLFFLLLLAGLQGVEAQEFVINPWAADTLKCYAAKRNGWEWEVQYEKHVMLPDGYTFQSVDSIGNDYFVFKHEGAYYAAKARELKFSSNNPEDMENPLSEEAQKRGSPIGEFYGSMSFLYVIIAIYTVALLVSLLYIKTGASFFRFIFLLVIPLAILAVSLIEIYGYYQFEEDIFWWCEYERYGFWGTLLRLIPFALLVVTQLLSIKFYQAALPHEFSIKPAAISLAVCLPLTIAAVIIMAIIGMEGTPAFEIISMSVFFLSLGTGVLITLVRNISSFGFFSGIFVTLFTIVYVISCIISVLSLITFSFKVIMMILAACFGIAILCGMANAAPTRTFVTKDGKTFYEV